jgi:hypothetical protein
MEAFYVRGKRYFVKVFVLFLILSIGFWLIATIPAEAGCKRKLQKFWSEQYGHFPMDWFFFKCRTKFNWNILAKAQPDGCYYGLADDANRKAFDDNYPNDLKERDITVCLDNDGWPKVNQAYVWGLTKFHKYIWFGTVPNTHCLVLDSFYGGPGAFPPHENSSWVCELSDADSGWLLRDARPPRVFMYNLKTNELIDKTQSILNASPQDEKLLKSTAGIRSAGAKHGVAFLGGIGTKFIAGEFRRVVNLFAFNAQTGEYLGARSFDGTAGKPHYNNIRQWLKARGQLYAGVGKPGGGEVLRWTGHLSNNPDDVFQFETVGELQADPAYLAKFKRRVYISTWGGPPGSGNMVLYMSPKFGDDRMLTAEDKMDWEIVWRLSDYEVEAAAIQGGGALAAFGGYLYWGTMHVPGTGFYAFQLFSQPGGPYAGAPPEAMQAAALGTYRPIVIFRGKHFAKPDKKMVELLYGSSKLPKYDPMDKKWKLVPNNMGGQAPKFGHAGINNFFNNYTWTMGKYHHQLFVGTMDWLYLLGEGFLEGLVENIPDAIKAWAPYFYGADLYRFCSNSLPAIPVSLSGVGNHTSYGVRTMQPSKVGLFLGMANPMNLLTDPDDDLPEGGWELIKLEAVEYHHCK